MVEFWMSRLFWSLLTVMLPTLPPAYEMLALLIFALPLFHSAIPIQSPALGVLAKLVKVTLPEMVLVPARTNATRSA